MQSNPPVYVDPKLIAALPQQAQRALAAAGFSVPAAPSAGTTPQRRVPVLRWG
jgi:hypothetical protein